jgi:O-antigen ligase
MIRRLDHGRYAHRARTATPLVVWVVVPTIMLSGLVDLPRLFTLGPTTLLAPLTVAYAFSAWTLLVVRPIFIRPAILALWPFVALLVWCCATFLSYTPSVAGVQNVLVLSTAVGFALLVSYECYLNPRFAELVRTTIVRAVWLAAALYVVGRLSGVLGFGELMGSRSFALFALLGVACHLGAWRHSGQPLGLWQAMLLTLLIGVSLSRTALLAALILFPLSQLSVKDLRSWLRVGLMIAFIAILSYLAVTYIEPLNERFFEGDRAYQAGGVTINTSGRTEIWEVVWDSYLTSPITGLGAGSAEETLAQRDPTESGHPHNDYLRFLHDYGPLGLGLWCLGFLCLLWTTGRSGVGVSRRGEPDASVHLAALLSLAGLALAMITDNLIVYVFVMAPLGALVGASLGRVGHQLQKHV